MAFTNPLTIRIADFLKQIGLEVLPASFAEQTFLPGILVANGRLLVDESKLQFPGDLLHEAGHLAVAPRELRSHLSGEVNLEQENMNAIESQAMAWSMRRCYISNWTPKSFFTKAATEDNRKTCGATLRWASISERMVWSKRE